MRRANLTSTLGLLALLMAACQPVAPSPLAGRQPAVSTTATLLGTWELVSVDGLAVRPKAVKVTFDQGGAFLAIIDCNRAEGYYSVTGAKLSFVGWTETERGCEAPLQHEKLIEQALRGDGYALAFTNGSELHLSGSHTVVFRRM